MISNPYRTKEIMIGWRLVSVNQFSCGDVIYRDVKIISKIHLHDGYIMFVRGDGRGEAGIFGVKVPMLPGLNIINAYQGFSAVGPSGIWQIFRPGNHIFAVPD